MLEIPNLKPSLSDSYSPDLDIIYDALMTARDLGWEGKTTIMMPCDTPIALKSFSKRYLNYAKNSIVKTRITKMISKI